MRSKRWRIAVGIFLILAAIGGGVWWWATPRLPPALDELLVLMQQRLAVMPEVARWKWNEGKPIADPKREEEQLQALVRRSREKGHDLDEDFIRTFFTAQVTASKRVQERAFERWKRDKQGKFKDVPKLEELRGKIDRLSDAILNLLPDARQALAHGRHDALLRARGLEILVDEDITEEVRAMALQPLLGKKQDGRRRQRMEPEHDLQAIFSAVRRCADEPAGRKNPSLMSDAWRPTILITQDVRP